MNTPAPAEAIAAAGESPVADRFAQQLIDELGNRTGMLRSWSQETERVRAALVDDSVKHEKLARLLSTDVRQAITVLHAADSPLFGAGGRSLNDLKQAVIRLGHQRLRCITYGSVLTQVRESPRLLHLRAELLQLSNNSTSVAAVAWLLAARVAGIDADEAMFAGLMHNAGKLCILARLDVASELYTDRRLRLMLLMRWHAAVAQSLLESWQLPEWLCAAVGAQDTLGDRAGNGRGLNEVLAAAVIAARTSTDIDATATHLANFSSFGLEVGEWRELLQQAPATTTAMRALFSD